LNWTFCQSLLWRKCQWHGNNNWQN